MKHRAFSHRFRTLVFLSLPIFAIGLTRPVALEAFTILADSPVFAEASVPDSPNPPDRPVRLIFIHHSTGEAWLGDDYGGLGIALRNNRYFVSDTNYGWGPATPGGSAIGDLTDIGHWWLWFRSPERNTYLDALYRESGQHCGYSRLKTHPGGPNEIILFKSCFPNSALQGSPTDPVPSIKSNRLRGEGSGSEHHTVANAKGIYLDLLNYFKSQRDKLFVVVTAPPLTDPQYAANARAFNQWLVNTWLNNYPYRNVFVFDFYNVLTTNGGSPDVNDLGKAKGNHHRWWRGAMQHKTNGDNDGNPNVLEYPSGDDHPGRAGDVKATAEFVKLLNVAYNRWRPPLGEVLDNTDLKWTSGGASKWFGQTATSKSDGDAAQSGRISNSAASWLQTTVTGPGTLKFLWRVSSQENRDLLRFTVDGGARGKISGQTTWQARTFAIGDGEHTLRWTYRKDGSGKVGADSAWLDQVTWMPAQ